MDIPLKILVLRFSSIGDIVLCSPVVRHLRQLKNTETHFLTKQKFAYLLEHNPNIDKVWTFETSIDELKNELKKEGFSWVIDLHNNLRTARLKRYMGVRNKTFRKLNIQKWLLTNVGIDRLPNIHVVDRYLETIDHFKIARDGKGLDFYFPDGFSFSLLNLPKNYCVAAIGGQHDGKKFPEHKWREVLKKVKVPIVLIGGKEDQEVANALSQEFEHVQSTAGKTNVFESAKIIEGAACLLSNDTGMMHIGSAFDLPIISLWGQTTPKFGMSPYLPHPDSVIVEPKEKRPLSKLGNKSTSVHAMESIDTDWVAKLIQEFTLPKQTGL